MSRFHGWRGDGSFDRGAFESFVARAESERPRLTEALDPTVREKVERMLSAQAAHDRAIMAFGLDASPDPLCAPALLFAANHDPSLLVRAAAIVSLRKLPVSPEYLRLLSDILSQRELAQLEPPLPKPGNGLWLAPEDPFTPQALASPGLLHSAFLAVQELGAQAASLSKQVFSYIKNRNTAVALDAARATVAIAQGARDANDVQALEQLRPLVKGLLRQSLKLGFYDGRSFPITEACSRALALIDPDFAVTELERAANRVLKKDAAALNGLATVGHVDREHAKQSGSDPDPRAPDALVRILTTHRDSHFRQIAAQTLGLLESRVGIHPLFNALSDPDQTKEVKRFAAYALAEIAKSEGFSDLERADLATQVAHLNREILERGESSAGFGSAEASLTLLFELGDTNPRLLIRTAAHNLGCDSSGTKAIEAFKLYPSHYRVAETLLRESLSSGNHDACFRAIRALRALGESGQSGPAVSMLRNFLLDERPVRDKPELQMQAASALAEIRGSEAYAAFLEFKRLATDESVREWVDQIEGYFFHTGEDPHE